MEVLGIRRGGCRDVGRNPYERVAARGGPETDGARGELDTQSATSSRRVAEEDGQRTSMSYAKLYQVPGTNAVLHLGWPPTCHSRSVGLGATPYLSYGEP